MKNLVILGSTGSIGQQTVDVIKKQPDRFRVLGLAAGQDRSSLLEQAAALRPSFVCLSQELPESDLKAFQALDVSLMTGDEGVIYLAGLPDVDVVVNAIPGTAGLAPTLKALESGKRLALANKESLVSGGELITEGWKSQIAPIDSEASALFQCLIGENRSFVEKLMITGSGGPFRGQTLDQLEGVTPELALAHPRWNMGSKVSIDSATLINKGLEVIEAHYLFGVGYDRIEVVIHPQSIVHSFVEFQDGSVKAQLSATDMRIPIQYALSFPDRLESASQKISLPEIGSLTFEPPDWDNFPCLGHALEAANQGRTYPAVLNAANEEAVDAFLERGLPFTAIAEVVYGVLAIHKGRKPDTIDAILEAESWARIEAAALIDKYI